MTQTCKSKAALVLLGIAGALVSAELAWRASIVARYAIGTADSLEGFKSAPAPETAERGYCRYDELLGWSPEPNVRTRWQSGSAAIAINPQGFRGEGYYGVPKPAGKKRILVMGDSYTFGSFVGDEQTYPARLGQLLGGKAEVANLGVTGYGVDQALLRLERDGLPLKPDIVVFALIMDDLRRAHENLGGLGYGKPRFVLDGGELKLVGVPPIRPLAPGKTFAAARPSGGEVLRLVFGLHSVSIGALREALDSYRNAREFSPLYGAIFRRLRDDCRKAEARLLVVMLATPRDRAAKWGLDLALGRFLRTEGIDFVSLIPLDGNTDGLGFIGGHPDRAQHRRIASKIYDELKSAKAL